MCTVILALTDCFPRWLGTTELWWRFASSTASCVSGRSTRHRCTLPRCCRPRRRRPRSPSPSASSRCGNSHLRCLRLTSTLTIRSVQTEHHSSTTNDTQNPRSISRNETSSSRYTWPQCYFNSDSVAFAIRMAAKPRISLVTSKQYGKLLGTLLWCERNRDWFDPRPRHARESCFAYTRSMAAMATISKCKINLNVGTRLQNRKLYKANML